MKGQKGAFLVAVLALCPAALPLWISYKSGGWVRKYTSPEPFQASDIPDMSGKVALVTGANAGIGLETARALALKGAEVYVTTRTIEKGEAAVRNIKTSFGSARVHALPMDLGELASVKACAQAFIELGKPLHILVLNAGVMKSPGVSFVGKQMTYGFETTADGFEAHIGVNHVGHFAFARLLEGTLLASAPARIIAVSSVAARNAPDGGIVFDSWLGRAADYEDGRAYGQSKLANILYAAEANARLSDRGVHAVSCHPGIIATGLGRHMAAHMQEEAKASGPVAETLNAVFFNLFSLALFTQADGALTQLQLATMPAAKLHGGAYYEPIGHRVHAPHAQAANTTLQRLLWQRTEELVAAKGIELGAQ